MAYGDRIPWPQAADGNGYTLVRRNPAGAAADPCRWRGSANVFGSPGQADPAGGQVVCDAMATVRPDAASQLAATDSGGGLIEINVAAQSVTTPVDLLYKRLDSVPSAPVRFRWAHRAFDLTAYQNGQPLTGFSLRQPLGMMLRYTDQEVAGLQENTLALFLLDGSSWQPAAETCPLPSTWVDPVTNRLQLQLCHLTTFGLFGRLAGADLALSLTVNPGMAFPGQSLTYTISYTNDGPQAASGVVIEDPLPGALAATGYSFSGPQATPVPGTHYTWQIASVPAGQAGEIVVTGVLSGALSVGAIITNAAAIHAVTPDGNAANNGSTATTTVLNAAPQVVDDVASTLADTPVSIAVLANDSDPNGDALTITAVSTPLHGQTTVAGSVIIYTPVPHSSGPNSFIYTGSDGQGGRASATVTVIVVPRPTIYLPLALHDAN